MDGVSALLWLLVVGDIYIVKLALKTPKTLNLSITKQTAETAISIKSMYMTTFSKKKKKKNQTCQTCQNPVVNSNKTPVDRFEPLLERHLLNSKFKIEEK